MPKGGGTMASVSLNGSLGTELPAGSRGRVPGWESDESFLTIFIQKVAKVKDLNENLPRI